MPLASFEIGKTYYQDFRDGDRVYFIPAARCNNGNWSGVKFERYKNGAPHQPKQIHVSHPPLPSWQLLAI